MTISVSYQFSFLSHYVILPQMSRVVFISAPGSMWFCFHNNSTVFNETHWLIIFCFWTNQKISRNAMLLLNFIYFPYQLLLISRLPLSSSIFVELDAQLSSMSAKLHAFHNIPPQTQCTMTYFSVIFYVCQTSCLS